MRINANQATPANEGDTRIKSGFLFLPKKLNGEWRWLERAKCKQTYMRLTTLIPGTIMHQPSQTHLAWVSVEWVSRTTKQPPRQRPMLRPKPPEPIFIDTNIERTDIALHMSDTDEDSMALLLIRPSAPVFDDSSLTNDEFIHVKITRKETRAMLGILENDWRKHCRYCHINPDLAGKASGAAIKASFKAE